MRCVLVKIVGGKREIIETGSRSKLQDRMKQLRASTMRGVCGRRKKKYKVQYLVENADSDTV